MSTIEMLEAILLSQESDDDPARSSESDLSHLSSLKAGIAEQVRDLRAEDPAKWKDMIDLLESYDELGRSGKLDADSVTAAFEIMKPLRLKAVVKLLFGHPIWSVREAAASSMSELIRNAHKSSDNQLFEDRRSIIKGLLSRDDNPMWRVRYGAHEVAYQVRGVDPELFYASVAACDTEENSKVQGLCAENLVTC